MRGSLIALALAAVTAVGCSTAAGGDKAGGAAGGAGGPVVLQLASTPSSLDDIPPVAEFVRRVAALSGGSLQINVTSNWGEYAPGAEDQVVHAVASGRVDLGWSGSRVFDTLGVPGFRALSAPMLIDSYPLEKAVLRSSLPVQMLAGLSKIGVIGLGILGEPLRLPISTRRPLLAPADWHGIGFGTYRSQVQELAIRALGATPVEAFGINRDHDLLTGQIQGFELDVRRYVTAVGSVAGKVYVAANVVLWPQFDVLIANPHRLASLPAQQRGWLQQAAADAAGDSVALAVDGSATSNSQACAFGARFVDATPADLAAMRRALSVVYQSLETDPQTRAFIRLIQQLKTATQPGPASRVPAACTLSP
jgi:TRAP-type C4-dicarboxylate transport system substrate-binding protein